MAGVLAVHGFQHVVASALYGQMYIFTNVVIFCHHTEDIQTHILRIGSRKTNSHLRNSLCYHFQQLCEMQGSCLLHLGSFVKILFRTATIPKVGIYILSKESDFLITIFPKFFALVDNRMRVSASFPSTSERHDAESTHIITSTGNRYESSYTISAQTHRTDVGISFFFGKHHIDGISPFRSFFQKVR